MTEQFANRATTTLNGAIDNVVTSIPVANAAAFPNTNNFRIVIDAEIMLVTAVTSNTFTVTRGAEGTAAASHLTLATVTHVLTAGAIQQFRSDNMQVGVVASLPTAGIVGRLYQATDAPYTYYDTGTKWQAVHRNQAMTPPQLSNFTWINQGSSATANNNNGFLYISTTDSGNVRLLVQPLTNLSNYTATCCFYYLGNFSPSNNPEIGIALYDSTSGKIIFNAVSSQINSYARWEIEKWTNSTNWNGNYGALLLNGSFMMLNALFWLRFRDDGTNRFIEWSTDGYNWLVGNESSRTDFMTPDHVGFAVCGDGNLLGGSFMHFAQTSP